MTSFQGDIADPILYRTYFSLMMGDILHHMGKDATKKNKKELHEFHKNILGYKTIAGESQDVVSKFLFEVCAYHAAVNGIFVRTNKKQPEGIEWLPLEKIWHLL